MFNTQQARNYLSVSMSTIHKWVKNGEIPCHRLGRNWRFYKEELDQWVLNGGAAYKYDDKKNEELKNEQSDSIGQTGNGPETDW